MDRTPKGGWRTTPREYLPFNVAFYVTMYYVYGKT